MNGKVICIIAAGGSGKRLKSRVAKPYVKIAGVPLIVRTLRIFDKMKEIDGIVVAVEPARIASCRKLLRECGIAKVVDVVAGGETRQASVCNGLNAAPADTEIVCIQDCARPFTDTASVAASIRAAREHGGAVVGIRATDTIKETGAAGRVVRTVDRSAIWYAQTPQTFRYAEIRAAYEEARDRGIAATDDANLFELSGRTVVMVPSGSKNIKITTPDDIAFAEYLIKKRKA